MLTLINEQVIGELEVKGANTFVECGVFEGINVLILIPR
jgi:hypothetical protein